jgi:hypothetical protein
MKYFFIFSLFFCFVGPVCFAQEVRMSDLVWRQIIEPPPPPPPPPAPPAPPGPPPPSISRLLITLDPSAGSAKVTVNGRAYKADGNGYLKCVDLKADETNVVITHPDYEQVKETILLTRGKVTVRIIKMVPLTKENVEKIE